MCEEMKWRFPKGNYSTKKGISSPEFEAFKKDPFKSLSREVIQNSIDAAKTKEDGPFDEEPVSVEFHEFKLARNKIPGVDDFQKQLENCLCSWKSDNKCKKVYQEMIDEIKKNEIKCLRISDFNTTGLKGISSYDVTDNQFLALTKGTGVSKKKPGITGGSKGVGKYAAFGTSKFSLIFYTTKTVKNETGSIGVAELVSSEIPGDSTRKDWTQGIGFYSINDFNDPTSKILKLDPSYDRGNREGTDLYIIGFKAEDGWETDVITRLLDSFLVNIYYNKLEITINGLLINKDSLKDIVYSDIISKKEKSNIISQYRLISNEKMDVLHFDIETDYGTLKLFILPLNKEEEALATHKCAMIRYPYMKIKTLSLNNNIRASAICLIPDNKLGEILLSIENPQHTDWELKRIEDVSERTEIKNTLNQIKDDINQKILESLQKSGSDDLDPTGAGDYIPGVENGDNTANDGDGKEETPQDDTGKVVKVRENKPVDKKPISEEKGAEGVQPDIGDESDDDGDDVIIPEGGNDGGGKEPHPEGDPKGKKEGTSEVYSLKELSGIKYRIIMIDSNNGKYVISFNYVENLQNCRIKLNIIDDNMKSHPVVITKINEKDVLADSHGTYGNFEVIKGKNKIKIESGLKDLYSFEVKIYANC